MHSDARLHGRSHLRPALRTNVAAPQIATTSPRPELEATSSVPFAAILVANGDHVKAIMADLAAVKIYLDTVSRLDLRMA